MSDLSGINAPMNVFKRNTDMKNTTSDLLVKCSLALALASFSLPTFSQQESEDPEASTFGLSGEETKNLDEDSVFGEGEREKREQSESSDEAEPDLEYQSMGENTYGCEFFLARKPGGAYTDKIVIYFQTEEGEYTTSPKPCQDQIQRAKERGEEIPSSPYLIDDPVPKEDVSS